MPHPVFRNVHLAGLKNGRGQCAGRKGEESGEGNHFVWIGLSFREGVYEVVVCVGSS